MCGSAGAVKVFRLQLRWERRTVWVSERNAFIILVTDHLWKTEKETDV
jgi:hypothetical protein